MNIDTMPAGREMDALVAEKVMGLSVCQHSKTGSVAQGGGFAMCGDRACRGERHADYLPRFSADIAAAWDVINEVCVRFNYCGFRITRMSEGDGWEVVIGYGDAKAMGVVRWMECGQNKDDVSPRVHNAAPLAICRAALKVVGVREVP